MAIWDRWSRVFTQTEQLCKNSEARDSILLLGNGKAPGAVRARGQGAWGMGGRQPDKGQVMKGLASTRLEKSLWVLS